jgi:peptide deformylase
LSSDKALKQLLGNRSDDDTPELHQLLDDMFESMYATKGVVLAAPQIGISSRSWAFPELTRMALVSP